MPADGDEDDDDQDDNDDDAGDRVAAHMPQSSDRALMMRAMRRGGG